jgi:hypothetical protein
MAQKDEKTVLMTRRVAERWLKAVSFPEHRFRVFYGAENRHLYGLLHAFRDGRVAMTDVPRVYDLGIKERPDGAELWSKDREGLHALAAWFEKRGHETTGVW